MAEDHGKDPAAQSFQDEAKQAITEQLSSVSDALEGGLSAASDALLSTTAAARGEAAAAASAVQAWYGAGLGHLRQLDSLMIGTLKHGVTLAVDHETAASAAGLTALALLLPAPRRFLWRQTLGRLQSAEAAHKAAAGRVAALAERVEAQGGEVQKLGARLAAAREEHARGLAKLKATAAELRSLSGRVYSTERSARALMGGLRELRSREALQLRSDAAVKAAAAAGQRATLEKLVAGLEREGV